ncbi:MAG: IS4 family transposase, partial [Candidatus Paceibacterota bacterium]
ILGNKIPRQISFRSAVQFISEITTDFLKGNGKTLQSLLLGILEAIASVPIGRQKRKRQPRAVKRRPKAYPLLTVPRYEIVV